jgi:hypothetical protein
MPLRDGSTAAPFLFAAVGPARRTAAAPITHQQSILRPMPTAQCARADCVADGLQRSGREWPPRATVTVALGCLRMRRNRRGIAAAVTRTASRSHTRAHFIALIRACVIWHCDEWLRPLLSTDPRVIVAPISALRQPLTHSTLTPPRFSD